MYLSHSKYDNVCISSRTASGQPVVVISHQPFRQRLMTNAKFAEEPQPSTLRDGDATLLNTSSLNLPLCHLPTSHRFNEGHVTSMHQCLSTGTNTSTLETLLLSHTGAAPTAPILLSFYTMLPPHLVLHTCIMHTCIHAYIHISTQHIFSTSAHLPHPSAPSPLTTFSFSVSLIPTFKPTVLASSTNPVLSIKQINSSVPY